jgi:hypothetical protein
MRPPRVPNYSWYPIESAPFDEDAVVKVTDGRGAPYALRWPCRQTAAGWINSAKGTPLALLPTAGSTTMTSRRFPPPWHADPIPGSYVVRDANGQHWS